MFSGGNMSADLGAIAPILILWGTACVVLLGDVWVWRSRVGISAGISLLGVLAAAVVSLQRLVWAPTASTNLAFAGTVSTDAFTNAAGIALLITAALSILMAWTYLNSRKLLEHGEYYVLLLFSVSGAMLMAAAHDLIVLFLGLEVLSLALYVLAGFARTDERSQEASIKYFLLGAFASGFFIYGIALTYGAVRSTNLSDIATAVSGGGPVATPMLLGGIAMMLVGLAFKAGVVPFHQWTPDVYEGAPTSVTAFMAGAAKIGAFVAILRVFGALVPVAAFWLPPVRLLAVLTMFGGNLLAIQQTNIKRMLAYSSIAHAGYLLVAVAVIAQRDTGPEAYGIALSGAFFYLFAYIFMTLGAFSVLIFLGSGGKDYQTLDDVTGLARRSPLAAYTMMFFLLSLGGIPTTMGFMGKWQIFLAALKGNEMMLAIAMALASVPAVFYYLKVVWTMCFEEPLGDPDPASTRGNTGAAVSLAVAAVATLLFGLAPSLLYVITNIASSQ